MCWTWSVCPSKSTLHPSLPCSGAQKENMNGLHHWAPLPSCCWLEFNEKGSARKPGRHCEIKNQHVQKIQTRKRKKNKQKRKKKRRINMSSTDFITLPAQRALLLQSLSSEWYHPHWMAAPARNPGSLFSSRLSPTPRGVTATHVFYFLLSAFFSASTYLTWLTGFVFLGPPPPASLQSILYSVTRVIFLIILLPCLALQRYPTAPGQKLRLPQQDPYLACSPCRSLSCPTPRSYSLWRDVRSLHAHASPRILLQANFYVSFKTQLRKLFLPEHIPDPAIVRWDAPSLSFHGTSPRMMLSLQHACIHCHLSLSSPHMLQDSQVSVWSHLHLCIPCTLSRIWHGASAQ